jgi:hypothetical protein
MTDAAATFTPKLERGPIRVFTCITHKLPIINPSKEDLEFLTGDNESVRLIASYCNSLIANKCEICVRGENGDKSCVKFPYNRHQ